VAYNQQKLHRKSIRHPSYDYREDGAYFITICTRNRVFAFGEIADDLFRPTKRGLIARACWEDIPNHRSYVSLDEFVVMPNHVHGVFWIEGGRATQVSPLHGKSARLVPASVGAIVGAYKAAVSRQINKLRQGAATGLWQPNYYEHIVRTDRALDAIREYIVTNPQRWAADPENPSSNGGEDIEAFLRSLDVIAVPRQGDTSVAPTREARG
jgi:putative transposase